MTEKRFTSCGNRIKRNGKLLNIEFKTKTDAKLCCKLCNQMDKHQQEYIDELNEIFEWYKDYYGETILDTRMGWNDDNKISKLEKENEQLKQQSDNKQKHIVTLENKIGRMREAIHKLEWLSTHRNADLQRENYKLKKENNLLKNSEAVTDQKELQKLIFQTVINLIDEKIKEWQSKPQLAVKMPIDCEYKQSCLHNQEINVVNASKLAILKELKEELPNE